MKDGTKQYLETIAWLGELYNYMNDKLFNCELKRPVITVQADESGRAYGWFTLKRMWKENPDDEGEFEINMSAQYLARHVNEIASTLIHEMCHQYAQVHNIQDCSRSGTYHNKHFKEIAGEHGLQVEKVDRVGWSHTSLTGVTAELLGHFLNDFPAKLICRECPQKGTRVTSSSTRKYVCRCCGVSVRATRVVSILCADCMQLLTLA